jgi:hypothetical protein
VSLAFRTRGGIAVSSPLGDYVMGRCGAYEQYAVEATSDFVAVSFAKDEERDMRCYSCWCFAADGGESVPANEADGTSSCPDETMQHQCQMCCSDLTPSETVTSYFRAGDGAALAEIHFPSDVPREDVAFVDGGVRLRGGACGGGGRETP